MRLDGLVAAPFDADCLVARQLREGGYRPEAPSGACRFEFTYGHLSDPLEQDDRPVRRDDGFLPVRAVALLAALHHRALLLALDAQGIDRLDFDAVARIDMLYGVGNLDLVGVQAHPEVVLVHGR